MSSVIEPNEHLERYLVKIELLENGNEHKFEF